MAMPLMKILRPHLFWVGYDDGDSDDDNDDNDGSILPGHHLCLIPQPRPIHAMPHYPVGICIV